MMGDVNQAINQIDKVDSAATPETTAAEDAKNRAEELAAKEPPFTTWKIREDGEVCHTIDYVFYSHDKLKVLYRALIGLHDPHLTCSALTINYFVHFSDQKLSRISTGSGNR